MGWRPQVEVNGQWAGNSLCFRTKEEADQSAIDLMHRWLICTDSRAIQTGDEPTHSYEGRVLAELPEVAAARQRRQQEIDAGVAVLKSSVTP